MSDQAVAGRRRMWISEPKPDGSQWPTSIVEGATDRIREEIMSGRIRPGERIRLNTLKDLLGVSHSPIREALRRLEGEGLVENVPRRGAVATPLSSDEFCEIYDLRKLIEPAIAARALPAEPARLAELSDVLEEMYAITEGWGSPDFAVLHRRFHWLVLERGANPTIEQVLRQLWQTSQRYIIFGMTTVEHHETPVSTQHLRLLNAVKSGDGERLAREIRLHLEHTESVTREALRMVRRERGLLESELATGSAQRR